MGDFKSPDGSDEVAGGVKEMVGVVGTEVWLLSGRGVDASTGDAGVAAGAVVDSVELA